MFGDMMGKLQEAQKQAEETKRRLDTVYLSEEGANGLIKITISGNREIKDIHIDDSLMQDAEELSDHLVNTLNKAIKKASEMNEREMQATASGMLNMPGMDKLFGK
jgi:hypothetical protein